MPVPIPACIVIVAVVVLQAFASGEPFGWRTRGVTDAPLPDLTNAPALPAFAQRGVFTNEHSGSSATRLSMRSSPAPGLPTTLPVSDDVRIRELARKLDHDWRKCYSFVRDHIAYAPYFGILRGPERTLLDREGSDADQALLPLALLRASGHDATVACEPLAVSGGSITSGFYMPLWDVGGQHAYNAASWLDVPVTGTVDSVLAKVYVTLSRARRPVTYATVGSVPCVVTDYFWVVLAIDDLTYYLDPSFKPTVRTAGRDAATDMTHTVRLFSTRLAIWRLQRTTMRFRDSPLMPAIWSFRPRRWSARRCSTRRGRRVHRVCNCLSGCPGSVPIVPTVPDVPSDVLGIFAYDALGNRIRGSAPGKVRRTEDRGQWLLV